MTVIGVDVGTSNSAEAVLRGGRPVVILVDAGRVVEPLTARVSLPYLTARD